MEKRKANPLGNVQSLLPDAWRLEPHTLAHHASDGQWKPWPHLKYIGEQVTNAVVGGNGRVIVNLPPGYGKSQLISHWTSTWFLENFPERKLILASHGAELASDFGREVRNDFTSNPHLLTSLREDSKAADRWHTPQGGGMKTTGVGGGITGWRGNLILVDDPHPTWDEAMSKTHRKRVADWFWGTLLDRAEPDATIIIMMHRWHEEDLTGQVNKRSPGLWKNIRLPALAEKNDLLGRAEGEALCPARFTKAAVLQTKAEQGSFVFSAKYQQNPKNLEGGFFKRPWFKSIEPDRIPAFIRQVRIWDLAATAEDEAADPDWLVGLKMGMSVDRRKFITSLIRVRISAKSVEDVIKQTAASDGHGCAIRIQQEGASSGKILKAHWEKLLAAWDCRFTPLPKTGKEVRAGPYNAACERGEIFLLAAAWNEEFIEEHATFPNAAHDDQVDAAAEAYTAMENIIQFATGLY